MGKICCSKTLLKRYGQEHLLMAHHVLDEDEKARLTRSIRSIDFELMAALYEKTKQPPIDEQVTIEPLDSFCKDEFSEEERLSIEAIGREAIMQGQLAVVTMAGGQGTRLGFNGPKGAFVFDPENNKSIFEALTDTLKEACQEYGVNIPWYIMASHDNFEETIAFFDDHDCFGYPGTISFFTQGELPMLDLDGKILLDENFMVKSAADGHGGTLTSMEECGVLAAMKQEGIRWVSINGVDNVLVRPVDPLFLGLTIREGFMCGTKTIAKTNPQENVGVLCKKNGHVGVVEYTEITPEMAHRRDPDTGKLVFGDANALFNLFSMEALEMVAEAKLPYHVAVKKADYIDSSGRFVKGDTPNAYKFESFIFDAFELFDNICVLRVEREDEFAPIKNATGEDSPETALRMYKRRMGM